MRKKNRGYSAKINQPPGTLGFAGDQSGRSEVGYTLISYSDKDEANTSCTSLDEAFGLLQKNGVNWLNIDGIHNPNVISELGDKLQLHPLVLEDIMNPQHRPKLENHGDFIFIIFKIIRFSIESMSFEQEQISIILKGNTVVSLQEFKGDIFDSVRSRIKRGEGRIRRMQADYLVSCLLDLVVDNYFPILEDLDELIEDFETRLYMGSENITAELYRVQKQVSHLHRTVWPNRDVVSELLRTENKLISEKSRKFVKDIYDHTLQVMDLVESFRENINAIMQLSVAVNGDKLNRIMKFLTLVSTIFIPLSFIAGLYGMNFRNMPELQTQYGYFVVLGVMAAVFITMITIFKKRKWF